MTAFSKPEPPHSGVGWSDWLDSWQIRPTECPLMNAFAARIRKSRMLLSALAALCAGNVVALHAIYVERDEERAFARSLSAGDFVELTVAEAVAVIVEPLSE